MPASLSPRSRRATHIRRRISAFFVENSSSDKMPLSRGFPKDMRWSRRDQPMGTKSRGLVLLICAGKVGSPGSPAGWFGVRGGVVGVGGGPRARLLPYVAGKRVVPDSLHPGFGGDGRGCPWSLAGCDPDAQAGSPRPVSYGALGYAAAAAPFAGPSRPPLAMAGSQGVPVVRTAWS